MNDEQYADNKHRYAHHHTSAFVCFRYIQSRIPHDPPPNNKDYSSDEMILPGSIVACHKNNKRKTDKNTVRCDIAVIWILEKQKAEDE